MWFERYRWILPGLSSWREASHRFLIYPPVVCKEVPLSGLYSVMGPDPGGLHVLAMHHLMHMVEFRGIEISKLGAGRLGVESLEKAHELSYWPGSGTSFSPGSLDHVVAADHVQIKPLGG